MMANQNQIANFDEFMKTFYDRNILKNMQDNLQKLSDFTVDKTILLQAIIFDEFRKSAEKELKTQTANFDEFRKSTKDAFRSQTNITKWIFAANAILALAAAITIIFRI